MMEYSVGADLRPTSNLPENSFPGSDNFNSFEIRLASTAAELAAIYQFRYEVYVEEMRFNQNYADHANRSVQDPLDYTGYNFAAYLHGKLAGALRLNLTRRSDVGYYEELFDMRSAGQHHPDATSICTRFMIAPRSRGTTLTLRLMKAVYSFALDHRIRYNFANCHERLVPFFERFGYSLQQRTEDPEHGPSPVVRLDLWDRARLARIGSPLLAVFDAKHAGDSAEPAPAFLPPRPAPAYTAA